MEREMNPKKEKILIIESSVCIGSRGCRAHAQQHLVICAADIMSATGLL